MTEPIVICGAGIAGIAAAYHLTVHHGWRDVVLVDERAPLSLTSDKSTEAYRNWWPGPDNAMIALMNRSIDLLEEMADVCDNCFLMNRRGYLYITADPARVKSLVQMAERAEQQGAGPVRRHEGRVDEAPYQPSPSHGYDREFIGADLILDPDLLHHHYPYLAEDAVAALHARRCGWFSGQVFGQWLLEQARRAGARVVTGRVTGVDLVGGRVTGVQVSGAGYRETIAAGRFVNAAGPFAHHVANMMGLELPLFHELHLKLNFTDHLGVIPRDAPMIIWADPQHLLWSDEERAFLAQSEETRWLVDEFPAGIHCRPEGGRDSPIALMLWPYHTEPVKPIFPIPEDPEYPEVVLRGMARVIPALSAYLEHMPKPFVDGGYYTKTPENRPLIGPLPVEGAYVMAAFSGFGLMAAAAAAELLAAHITEAPLPSYAASFHPARYDDIDYVTRFKHWTDETEL
ncbi:MAG: FAD-binding oxidoreductase [Chloroflexi bacterium]|nr:FAD-binding oxidoreductase [Chloroflexota bacterium]